MSMRVTADVGVIPRMTGRALRRGLAGTVALLVAIFIFEFVIPPVAEEVGAERLDPLLEALPPAIQAISRTSPEFITFAGLAGYLSTGFTSPLYLLMTSAALIAFTASTLAGEMERGTIQLALSRPISRTQLYLSRVGGTALLAVLFASVGPLGLLAGLTQVGDRSGVEIRNLIPLSLAAFVLLWAIGGVSLLLSAIGTGTGRVVSWSLSWLLLSYFIDYFAAIWRSLEPLEPLSVFNYFDPAPIIVNGTLPIGNMAVLLLVGTVGFVVGHEVFVRRELPA